MPFFLFLSRATTATSLCGLFPEALILLLNSQFIKPRMESQPLICMFLILTKPNLQRNQEELPAS